MSLLPWLATGVATAFILVADPAAAGRQCGLPHLQGQRAKPKLAKHQPVARMGDAKLLRDAFGSGFQVATSENFALKWKGNVATTKQEALLEALEQGWQRYIVEYGHSVPTGGDDYLVNIYFAGPDDDPGIDFAGGYAWIDDAGYPYMVMSNTLEAGDLAHVAVHEFYHDIQLSLDEYWADEANWYWEATADWAAQAVYPEMRDPYLYIGPYALLGHKPVFNFEYVLSTSDIIGLHQYGASAFPRYVTERFSDPQIVVSSWEDADGQQDPLAVIGDLSGTAVETLFGDFAAHNVLWDYPQQDILRTVMSIWDSAYPEHQAGVSKIFFDKDYGVWHPVERVPGAFGYNIYWIARPSSGTTVVEFKPANGSFGSQPTYHVTLVRSSEAEGIRYEDIAVDGVDNSSFEIDFGEDGLVYLAVAVTADTRDQDEEFPYALRLLQPGQDPIPQPEPCLNGTCDEPGCSSGGRSSWLWLTVVVGLVLARRRSRQV